jgi:hypothetical protein
MTEVHHPLPAAGAYTRRVEARIPDEAVRGVVMERSRA